MIDLALSQSAELGPLRPFVEIPASANPIDAMVRMENAGQNLALVVDADGRVVGILTVRNLRRPLFQTAAG